MPPMQRFIPALVAAAALAASHPALCVEPEAVATAPATSVGDQIDAYLKTSPALALPKDGASGVTSGADEPRKVHGVVDVAVGSNGYRSVYMRSDMPVRTTGTVSVAVGETKFNGRGYGGYGGGGERQSLGLSLRLGEPALDPHDPRCRQAGEDGPATRYDLRFEGGRRHPCQAAEASTSHPPQ